MFILNIFHIRSKCDKITPASDLYSVFKLYNIWFVMKKEKNSMYEMMVIVKPLLPDDIRKVVHKSIVDLCKKLGGEARDVDVWGKRYLSYKIASHTEGYYLVYTFSLPASSLEEFKRMMGLKQEILRYLLINVEEDEISNKKYVKKKEMEVNF